MEGMVLTYAKYQLAVDMQENFTSLMILEDSAVFSDVVGMLYRQCEGESGDIILSEGGKTVSPVKTALMVMDYFMLDLNNRQILNRLYQELKDIGMEYMMEKEMFVGEGVRLLETVISHSRFDHVDYNPEMDWTDVFKSFRVRIDEEYTSLQEKVISFMRVCSELLGLKLIIFVSLKAYLSAVELAEVYRMAAYFKIHLLLIEPYESVVLPQEKCYIIDKDKCLICLSPL